MVKKEVIVCPRKMVPGLATSGPAKATAVAAKEKKAEAGEAVKDNAATVAAVRAEVLAVAGTQEPASLHHRRPDGQP